jgi:hypothetical protein
LCTRFAVSAAGNSYQLDKAGRCSLDLLCGLSLFQLWYRVGVHGELYYIALNGSYELNIYEVMMVVMSGWAVFFGQLDACSFDSIDRADMNAVLAKDLHVFSDFSHDISPG